MKAIAISISQRLIISAALLTAAFGANAAFAEEAGHDHAALIKALPNAKHSLSDGLRQATKVPEVPISAKFEFDYSVLDGKLVRTAAPKR